MYLLSLSGVIMLSQAINNIIISGLKIITYVFMGVSVNTNTFYLILLTTIK